MGKQRFWMRNVALCLAAVSPAFADTRPYEFRLVDRRVDFHPPLVEFETPAEWRVETKNAEEKDCE